MNRSILKYPGSKWRIAKWIVSMIPEHHSYLEPFFGSGAVLFNKPSSRIETINDMDNDVVNLFNIVRNNPVPLIKAVEATPYAREEYETAHAGRNDDVDEIEKARRFLVRCWQGHGFRTTGEKVGWKNDVQGREAAYAMRHWNKLPEWLLDACERLKNVQIDCRPAVDVIKRFNYPNVFIYADPPYVLSTRCRKQYKHEMTDDDHIELLRVLTEHKGKVIISGYDNDLYNTYLQGWEKRSISSADQLSRPRTEMVWMNFSKEDKV
ncbi:MAG: DNA adenine methylase [Oscillospiraceae bacterium]|nr:DNA adenine methylase [Oscillospiraceae bacterium]